MTKGREAHEISIQLRWNTQHSGVGVDAAAFLLSDQNRCERDEDFIFYGNPVSREGGVAHSAEGENGASLSISLSKIPQHYARIAVTLTIHEGEQRNQRMKDLSGLQLTLTDRRTGEELYRFEYGADLSEETAVVAGELYRHQGEWKFSAIGSGYNGGLAALCKSYGLEVEEETGSEVAATAEVAERVERVEPARPQAEDSAPVNVLSSIDLRIVELTLIKNS
ncbi:TerD family protein [Paenibacillus rhizoplanae]